MIFRNIFFGAVFIAATAFAQPADSTTNQNLSQTASSSASVSTGKNTKASLKKQQRVVKPATTWSKIKDLFE